MELKNQIDSLNFPDKYQDIINKINLERANDFVKAMLNTIINKYGEETVRFEIESDDPNSKISTHLTHILEVGGLKIISDNNLSIDNNEDFQNIILAVIFVLNCSLAIELHNLKMYNGRLTNYYNNEAMVVIINRLAKHSMSGINFSKGFEYHANGMIFNNLIGPLTESL